MWVAVNNVGTNVGETPTVKYSSSDYEFIMNTNLTSAFHLTQVRTFCRESTRLVGKIQGFDQLPSTAALTTGCCCCSWRTPC